MVYTVLLAAAFADEPIWMGNEARMPIAQRAVAVAHTSVGTLTYANSGAVEQVLPGAIRTVQLPRAVGRPHPARGCDLDGDGDEEFLDLVAHFSTARPRLRHPWTGAELRSLEQPTPPARQDYWSEFRCIDIDGDGAQEIVALGHPASQTTGDDVHIWNHDGSLRHVEHVAVDGVGLRLGQLDLDPAWELVLPGGEIYDLAGLTVEAGSDDLAHCNRGAASTGAAVDDLLLYDLDGNGMSEILQRCGDLWTMLADDRTVLWQADLGVGTPVVGDFDADGTVELVVSLGDPSRDYLTWTEQLFLDARTGAALHPPALGKPCWWWLPHDGDGDGVFQLLCVGHQYAHAVLDTATGRRVLLPGNGAEGDMRPMGADLDGDGREEVVWAVDSTTPMQDRVVVRDAQGAWLDGLAVDDSVQPWTVRDVDGDGRPELLHGRATWTWSASGGFVRGTDVAPGLAIEVDELHAYRDLNGDGHPDLVYSDDAELYRIDLSNGAVVDFGEQYEEGRAVIEDFDGDGHVDVLMQRRNGRLRWVTLDNTLIDTVSAGVWSHLEHGGRHYVAVVLGSRVAVYRFGAGLVLLGEFDLPVVVEGRSPAWLADRFWYLSGGAAYAWSPFDGSVRTTPGYFLSATRADDVVWLSHPLHGHIGIRLP